MLESFFMPAFKRQKETMVPAIDALEALALHRNMTQSSVLILRAVSHTLRNQLTVVSVVLEFNEIQEDASQKA
jgi:hypothetical protein